MASLYYIYIVLDVPVRTIAAVLEKSNAFKEEEDWPKCGKFHGLEKKK